MKKAKISSLFCRQQWFKYSCVIINVTEIVCYILLSILWNIYDSQINICIIGQHMSISFLLMQSNDYLQFKKRIKKTKSIFLLKKSPKIIIILNKIQWQWNIYDYTLLLCHFSHNFKMINRWIVKFFRNLRICLPVRMKCICEHLCYWLSNIKYKRYVINHSYFSEYLVKFIWKN